MDRNETRLYEIFREIGITDYEVHEHPPILTIEDADKLQLHFEGLELKNLLLKQKNPEHYFMVIIDDHRHMDLKHFKEVAGWGKVRFANEEEMISLLDVVPGAVTPLALFNDEDKQVTVVLGTEVVEAADDEIVNFHPCRYTATLSLKKWDLLKFLDFTGHEIIYEK